MPIPVDSSGFQWNRPYSSGIQNPLEFWCSPRQNKNTLDPGDSTGIHWIVYYPPCTKKKRAKNTNTHTQHKTHWNPHRRSKSQHFLCKINGKSNILSTQVQYVRVLRKNTACLTVSGTVRPYRHHHPKMGLVCKQMSLKSCNYKSRKAQLMFRSNNIMNELLFLVIPRNTDMLCS
jgi:hypothetical protein